MITNQVSLTANTATKIMTVGDVRNLVSIVALADCYVGRDNTVTASNGHLVKAGLPYYLQPGVPQNVNATTLGDIWGFSAAGTTVTYAEFANQ